MSNNHNHEKRKALKNIGKFKIAILGKAEFKNAGLHSYSIPIGQKHF